MGAQNSKFEKENVKLTKVTTLPTAKKLREEPKLETQDCIGDQALSLADNSSGQVLLSQTHYYGLLEKKRSDLMRVIDPHFLWPQLRVFRVIDEIKEAEIRHNAPCHETVGRLLDFLLKSPVWRFHSFLRALFLTSQGHIITSVLGLDPGNYNDEEYEVSSGTINPKYLWKEDTRTLHSTAAHSERLVKGFVHFQAIQAHAEGCKRNLMRRKVFDFKDDPAGDIHDTAKCYIQTKAGVLDEGEITIEISQEDILEGFAGELPPRGIRLEGPPGAGKTTYLRHVVHTWSTKYLEWSQDPLTEKPMPKWTLMVYIPGRVMKGNIRKAIHDHLWCADNDKEVLMKHVEEGKGVAVIIDAIDEIHDHDVLDNLKESVHEWQSTRGPTFLISARNELCSVDPADFNRFLILEGFTIDQGEEYVKKYFSIGQTSPAIHPVIDFVRRHKCRLEPILCNPLKLHIFCGLTKKGILELHEDTIFDVLTLFEVFEDFLIKREGGPVSQEQSSNFYRLCLYCLMKGFREIPGKLLKQFNIVENYYAFLVKETTIGMNAMPITSYSFHHEMFYEFFSSRCLGILSLHELKAMILLVSSKSSLWNLHKMIFRVILKRCLPNTFELLQMMVRCMLVFIVYYKKETRIPDELLELPKQVRAAVPVIQLLSSQQDEKHTETVTMIWDNINRVFESESVALRRNRWFSRIGIGALSHVLDCLCVCPPEQQQEITKNSLHALMPSVEIRHSAQTYFPVDSGRWGVLQDCCRYYSVFSWNLEDATDLVLISKQMQPDYSDISILLNEFQLTWGKPPYSAWSTEAGVGLLQEIRTMTAPDLRVGYSCTLAGLLKCASNVVQGRSILIKFGSAKLTDVEDWAFKSPTLDLVLVFPHIELPSGEDEDSLRDRVTALCHLRNARGRLRVEDPRWVTETGEDFTWTPIQYDDSD